MPITDVIKRRTYQNERKARIKQEAEIDAALVGNPQIAQAEEMRRIAQEYSERADRVEADARARVSGDNGNDRYGQPIGTHDSEGRELGQLDKENKELAALNKQLSKLNKANEGYTTELDKAKAAYENSETTEQKIEAKTKHTATEAVIKDNNFEIATLKDKIGSKQSTVERYEAEVKGIKDDIINNSPGGRNYEYEVAKAEPLLYEAEAQKRTADITLQGGHYGNQDMHHWEVQRNCAIENIATHSPSNVTERHAQRVAKSEESLKLYTLKP